MVVALVVICGALAAAAPAGAQLPSLPPLPKLPPLAQLPHVPVALPGQAGPTPLPYGTDDGGGFRNVLPPGTSGFDNALQLAQFEATGKRPPHADDQRDM